MDSRGWDHRAWGVGLISSNLCGMALTITAILEKASGATSHHGGGYIVATIATLTANFVLPGVTTLLARRRFLFWGLLPPLILIAWVVPSRYLLGQFGHLHRDFVIIPFYVILSVTLVSGPISAVRHFRVRAQHRREAALAALAAQREAASVPQEGVWPPPPDYRENLP